MFLHLCIIYDRIKNIRTGYKKVSDIIMTKYIDLHTHSICSDGTLTPARLVCHAKEKGLSTIALTDHDTIEGLEEAKHAASNLGIELINGVELSIIFKEGVFLNREYHMLALDFDMNNKNFVSKLERLRKKRRARNLKLINIFSQMGIDISYEELQSYGGGNVITKIHFARALVVRGFSPNINHAMETHLGYGTAASKVPRIALEPKEAIDMVRGAGGLTVLAHPLRYGLPYHKVALLIGELKAMGLNGVEAIYYNHTPGEEKMLTTWAKELNLGISGGTDFHGDNKPEIQLGTGLGNLQIPKEIWTNLQKIQKETK